MTASPVQDISSSKLKEHKPAPRVHLVTAGSNSGGNAGSPPICEKRTPCADSAGKVRSLLRRLRVVPCQAVQADISKAQFATDKRAGRSTCDDLSTWAKAKARKRGPSTKFYRLWSLFNGEVPKRRQPMNLEVFAGKFCMVLVETVVEDAKGNALPELLRYSVVREVLDVWEP